MEPAVLMKEAYRAENICQNRCDDAKFGWSATVLALVILSYHIVFADYKVNAFR